MAQAGTQTRTESPGALALEELRNVLLLQRLEGIAVAEKIRDGDEQVLQQRARLAGMGAQEVHVSRQLLHAIHLHAAGDAAHDGGALVVGEVPARAGAQEGQHLAQRRLVVSGGGTAGLAGCGPSSGGSLSDFSCWKYPRMRPGISATFSSQSTMPVSIEARGMLLCSASSGSCAMVSPPRSLMRLMPTAPSPSAPESTTAAACGPCVSASERKKRSTATRLPRSGVEFVQPQMCRSSTVSCLPGGIT